MFRICGSRSGRDVDKADACHFTLVDADSVQTPAIREIPLTLECKVLYQQDQRLNDIPEEIRARYYSRGNDVDDFHTAYIGQIVSAYIIREDQA